MLRSNMKNLLAISVMTLLEEEPNVKKKRIKKEIILDCCPKCGSKRCNDKKGGKRRCLNCGHTFNKKITKIIIKKEQDDVV